jgi:hypothetical protein
LKGVHPPLFDQSSTVRAEVVEVGPQFNPLDKPDIARPTRSSFSWLRAGALAALLVAGVALVPGAKPTPSATTVDLTLPQPVVATSTIPVAPRAVAVLSDENFALIPVTDLDGFANFAGPVEFQGRQWVAAGGPSPTDTATILSSTDGASWSVEAELVGPEPNLRVWDIAAFRTYLVVVASSSKAQPTGAPEYSQSLEAWTSSEGRTWTLQSLPDLQAVGYWDTRIVAGDDQVLITSGVFETYGDVIYPVIPDKFRSALAAGELFATWERRPDQLTVGVLAPPGMEIFSAEVPVTSPRLFHPSRVLWSDDLSTWDVVDPSMAGAWGLAWSDDMGFVRQGQDGGIVTSTDGQLWERNRNLPSGNYLSTENGLLGLVNNTGGTVDLLLLEDGQRTTIGLPNEMFFANGWPWIEVGPSGFIAAITRYELRTHQPPTVTSGDLLLTLDTEGRYQVLVITKNGQNHARIVLGTPSAIATYDPDSGLIEILPGEGIELTTVPLEDLVALWAPSLNSARTEFYQSPDGLIWSKSEAAVLSDGVTLIGGTYDGFLIGVRAGAAGREEAITVFRTGPVD